MRRLLPMLTAALLLGLPAAASADSRLEAMFQDDPRILSSDAKVRNATLDEARSLGVQRIRVTAFWNRFAPNATGTEKPANFDGSNPDAYEKGQWDVLDAVITGAKERGLAVNLNPSAPGPKWAGSAFIEDRLDGVTNPSPVEFAAFVAALGKRYAGTFTPAGGSAALPRVDYWSIWNEPNQGAWLAPQWVGTGSSAVPASAQRYRVLAAGAWSALELTGHTVATDTILVGDTAPKGRPTVASVASAMSPITFQKRLYCLDDRLQILKGAAAKAQDCSESGDAAQFVSANPALFRMTGYAHHPYELGFKPDQAPENPKENVTTANLGLLTDQLDRIMARYGVARKPVPLYLTEYGYQTNPPDRLGVSLNEQAAYINEGEYIAWRNSRVKTLSQFLLVDDAPIPGTDKADKWSSSFQTGLRYGPESGKEGKAKPALNAYRLAFFLPQRTVPSNRKLKVWGRVRPARSVTTVTLQLRGRTGSYRTFRTLKTNRYGFVNTTVRVRSSSRAARLTWKSGSRTFASRGVSFKVRKR
ncbi:unannotated protein [freshwater metagenome]|uniref:Unannotated protein n=1 Tax=freshwater metagenome TaxID=449393 RepID=A0A6J7GPH1_9ZZZZ|nr:hypothetical protein [Actinomycetota bacterium]